jgi:hypothetical protein
MNANTRQEGDYWEIDWMGTSTAQDQMTGALQFSILISEVPLSKIVNLEKTSLE